MSVHFTRESEVDSLRDRISRGHGMSAMGRIRETVGTQTALKCFQTHGASLRAVILTGSLARDEATVVEEKNKWRLLGDAEFLLIFHDGASVPHESALTLLRHDIEASISELGITGEICLSAAHLKYLRNLRPNIFDYELRNCGQVVGGDPAILAHIPNFTSAEIPLEDGWRLLSNRMVEQFDALDGLEQKPKKLSTRLLYRTIKLYLDMATSFLLFAGEYAPSYSLREKRLLTIKETRPGNDDFPFDLRSFCDRVIECMQLKLSQEWINASANPAAATELGFSWWEEAIRYAQLLWRWELALLTRASVRNNNQELLERWMKCQPVFRRLRGWTHVVREQGWNGTLENWRHWIRIGWCASPRDRVYQAASEVLFELPFLSKNNYGTSRTDADWEKVRSFLPVTPKLEARHNSPHWRGLAMDITSNYQRFLTNTRS